MSDLVEWLTKILDEDEGLALQTGQPDGYYPESFESGDPRHHEAVLADIAAKRAIIAEYVARDEDADLMLGPDCLRQREWSGLRLAVQLMATAYADRPGYDESWRP